MANRRDGGGLRHDQPLEVGSALDPDSLVAKVMRRSFDRRARLHLTGGRIRSLHRRRWEQSIDDSAEARRPRLDAVLPHYSVVETPLAQLTRLKD